MRTGGGKENRGAIASLRCEQLTGAATEMVTPMRPMAAPRGVDCCWGDLVSDVGLPCHKHANGRDLDRVVDDGHHGGFVACDGDDAWKGRSIASNDSRDHDAALARGALDAWPLLGVNRSAILRPWQTACFKTKSDVEFRQVLD